MGRRGKIGPEESPRMVKKFTAARVVGHHGKPGLHRRAVQLDHGPLMVKIFKCAEESGPSMIDVEHEHNHMRSVFGLRYGISRPATPAAE